MFQRKMAMAVGFLTLLFLSGCESVLSNLDKPKTPPSPPTGVSSIAADAQSIVSWNPVSGATSYNLYYRTSSGVTSANGTKITGVTSPYTHTGLTNGTTYYYVVTAVNAGGESADSGQTSALPQVPATGAPSGVSAVSADTQSIVSWNPVSGATSYNLYYRTSSGVTSANGTKITGVTSPYTHTGLTNGTTYYYVVTAVNAGGESSDSGQTSALPQVPATGAPSGVSAVSADTQSIVSWNPVSGATSYNLYYRTSSGVTSANGTKITGVTSPYTHTGLTNGTTYYYVVTAVNAGGESSDSGQTSATPQVASPGVPTGVGAAGASTQATVTWNPVSGATSYNLYYRTSSGVTSANGTKITGVTSPFTHTGLTNGTTYYYVVTAVNAGGESSPSNQAAAQPQQAPVNTGALNYWANGRGNPQNTGRSSFGTGSRSLRSRTLTAASSWIYVGSAGANGSFAVIDAEGTVYYQGTDNNLYAVRQDGTLKWKTLNPYSIAFVAPVIGPDGRIYVGDYQEHFYCFDALDGHQIWVHDFGHPGQGFTNAPLITDDGIIYISSIAGYLYSLDLEGNLLWSYQNSYSFQGMPGVAKDGSLYVMVDKLYCLNPHDGTVLWSFAPPTIPQQMPWQFESTPVIADDGTIYVIGYYNSMSMSESGNQIYLFAVDHAGNELWRYPLFTGMNWNPGGVRTIPTLQSDGTILVNVSPSNTIVAVKPDGSLKTQLVFTESLPSDASPSIDGMGRIYLSLRHGFAAVASDLSEVLWQSIVTDGSDGRDIECSPSLSGDHVYFTCRRQVFDSGSYHDAGELYSYALSP